MQNLYEILEIFKNFEQILKKFFEIFLFAYSFQINFPNHYVSGKSWEGGRAPHDPPHGPPMPYSTPTHQRTVKNVFKLGARLQIFFKLGARLPVIANNKIKII